MTRKHGAAAVRLRWIATVASVTVAAQFALAQEHRVFELTVKERSIALPDRTIHVEEGDRVELRITSDEEGELHLHGYDVTIELRADQTSVVTVDADVAGRFPVTSHGFGSSGDQGDGQHHETLLYLEVHPR